MTARTGGHGQPAGGPAEGRARATPGPRRLSLAQPGAWTVHPYVVPPQHTAAARETRGPDAVRPREQAIQFDAGPRRSREWARATTRRELTRVCGCVFGG